MGITDDIHIKMFLAHISKMVFKVKEENSTHASGDVDYDCKYNDGQKMIGETGTWTASVKSEDESEEKREEGLTKEAVTASYEYEDKL